MSKCHGQFKRTQLCFPRSRYDLELVVVTTRDDLDVLPRFASGFHVVGQRDIVGPHVILPLPQSEDSAKNSSRVDPYAHVELDIGGFHDAGDGVDHVQAHFHGAMGMVGARLWKTGHAVVAVAQDFDSEAVVVLKQQENTNNYSSFILPNDRE